MSSEETFTTEEIADLENWDRKRLQRQCKKVGIKANLKTVELLDSLRAHYQSNLTMDSADPRPDDVVDAESIQSPPKRRRTLSPERVPEEETPSQGNESPLPKRKARKKSLAKTSIVKKRLVKRRRSRRPSLRRKSLRALVKLLGSPVLTVEQDEQPEEENISDQPEEESEVKSADSNLDFEDLDSNETNNDVEEEEPRPAAVEAVETKETPLQKAGEEQKPETTTTTRDVATAAPKPQASTAGARKRKSSEMAGKVPDDKKNAAQPKKKPIPTVKVPKLTRTVLLRQIALQKEREQKQREKKKAEQQPAATATTSTTTARLSSSCNAISTKRKAATPLPVPSRGVRRVAAATTSVTPGGAKTKEAVRAKIPGKAAPGSVIKARPAPNFNAIHQQAFSGMKSIFDAEPSSNPEGGAPQASPSGQPSSTPSATTTTTTTTKPPTTPSNRQSLLRQSSGKVATTAATNSSRKRKLETETTTPSRITRTTSEYGLPRKETEKKAPLPKTPASKPAKPKASPLFRSTSSRTVGQKAPEDSGKLLSASSSKHTLPRRSKAVNNENERNKGNLLHK